ncbi:MAG TPA: flavoprotein, partial [Acidimicrobiales bacterium]|nr:flavoprotein [Acidimicrobiales bacterium]
MPSETPDLTGRTVVLGVAGGVAAYKSVELARRLVDAGAHVVPVLTADATRFVGALTFSALASEAARTSLFDDRDTPIPHTALGQRADVVVVAPATAHLIARYAAGLADDLLTATLLATRAPVLLCPAMHTEMWEQASVQETLAALARRGVAVL